MAYVTQPAVPRILGIRARQADRLLTQRTDLDPAVAPAGFRRAGSAGRSPRRSVTTCVVLRCPAAGDGSARGSVRSGRRAPRRPADTGNRRVRAGPARADGPAGPRARHTDGLLGQHPAQRRRDRLGDQHASPHAGERDVDAVRREQRGRSQAGGDDHLPSGRARTGRADDRAPSARVFHHVVTHVVQDLVGVPLDPVRYPPDPVRTVMTGLLGQCPARSCVPAEQSAPACRRELTTERSAGPQLISVGHGSV